MSSKRKKVLKIIGGLGILLFIGAGVVGFFFYRIYKHAIAGQNSAQSLVAAAESQNLDQIKSELENTKNSLSELNDSYKSITWMRVVPFIGLYVSDGQHALNAAGYGIEAAEIMIDTVEPYADIIGFTNDSKEAESAEETTQDRIDFVIKTIPDIIPKADDLAQKVAAVQAEIEEIDSARYPEKIRDFQVRSKIQKGKEMVELGAQLITNGKPLLEAAPYLLGTEEARTYLVIFQNDKELRPTGGFITAYSIAKVEKGKFEPVSSNDIYNLDNLYFPTTPAPDPIIDYLRGPYVISKNLRLRDINWSPDFSESMELFVKEVETVGVTDIDGIIAVDTQLLVNLLEVLGPIGVPGFGDFSTEIIPECNCPQVIYELESFADVEGPVVWSQDEPGKIIFAPPNIDNRKKIIGPLMNSILANALGQPKDKLPDLFGAAFKSLLEKHVLFYILEEDAQRAVEEFGIGGVMDRDYEGDYLHINDANLGGRKSNLYVTQEVSQEIEIAKDGSVEKVVTITYKNPEKFDGWLNSVLPNWVRIYVPKGSELISFDGVEDSPDPYEEFNKTVFAGFFELRPEGIAKVKVRYKLPFKVGDDEYKLLVQKQPGTDAPLYSILIDKLEDEFFLRTDKEFKFKI
ncbi:DUF4012 domain-containing protein [Patescibacteria group bacterium]|nr:DUF4012 domain-containing protein [Patescibacteria group bacterium]